jgi:hypothetical protein
MVTGHMQNKEKVLRFSSKLVFRIERVKKRELADMVLVGQEFATN